MSKFRHHQCFKVNLTLQAAGPTQPRRKYKPHKILRAVGCIRLPFVPYPGLYLTMEKPRKRGEPLTLYLRVRTAEWVLPAQHFHCVVDEILGSNPASETEEVRGGPRIEQHFVELGKTLKIFGFAIDSDGDALYVALNKYADGSWIKPPDT